jgi:hypothetical protein
MIPHNSCCWAPQKGQASLSQGSLASIEALYGLEMGNDVQFCSFGRSERRAGRGFQFVSPLDSLTESLLEKRIMVLPFSVFSTSEGTLSVAKSLGFGTSSWSL